MIGAIIGDVVGSRFEWNNIKSKDFDLFTDECSLTDDSLMSLAIAKAILDSNGDYNTLSKECVKQMQAFGRKYPHAGYGGMFRGWIWQENPAPYNSFGNGAAMRVSACGYAANNIEEAKTLAARVTEVTHNHPEGIKGAQAVAIAIYMARKQKSKDEIRKAIEKDYYHLSFTLDEIRPTYSFDVTCQGSVPQALVAFLESTSFEDAIRNAISIGGDSDTIAAITGSIAEAFYGVPNEIRSKVLDYMDDSQKDVLDEFESTKSFSWSVSLFQDELPIEPKKKAKTTKKSQPKELSSVQELYNYLFEACNIIRGPVSQDNFKDYITPLLYYKRISDVYDEETQDALEFSGGDEEFASLPEQHRFVIPDGCHWQDVREHSENLGAAIVGAMRQIEVANPDTLYGVLSIFSAQKWTDKTVLSDERIRNLIEHLSKRRLGNKDYPADLMGDAYEILLKKFADDSKAQAGEFYTPRSVVQLLVRILAPQAGETVYDPACGSGGMLIEAIHYMHNDTLCCGSIFGQEKNVTNAAIAKMNLFLHGASDFHIRQGDTLRNPKILQKGGLARFDCVIANPPFALKDWGSTEWSTDKYGRNLWGTPNDSCGDYAWIQHMVASMSFGVGRMAVVMPQGVLFRGGVEQEIRKKLVDSDLVEAVITIGEKLFYGTGLSPCILILRRTKPAEHSARILIIDASKVLTTKRAQNILTDEDVNQIYKLYSDYADVEDYSRVVTLKEIADKEYELAPNRYVKYHEVAVKPYAEVIAEFKAAYENMLRCEEEFEKLINAN